MNISVSNLHFAYHDIPIFSDFSIDFPDSGLVGLIGENGSGKSTFIKTVSGVYISIQGKITYNDVDIKTLNPQERARLIGYVPQHGIVDGNTIVYDYIMLGRKPYFDWRERPEDHRVVERLLAELDLEPLAFRMTGELSGGEQQKVLIARTLAQSTPVIFLDEPTSNLDIRYQTELLTLLRGKVENEGLVIIMAIHDLHLAYRYSDKLLLLKNGELLAYGDPEQVICEQNIKEAFSIDNTIIRAGEYRFVVPK